jgi:hypothetical protein
MARLLDADYKQIQALAGVLTDAATMIKAVNATNTANGIAAALPGSGLDGVCTQAGQYIDGAYQRVAGKYSQIADSMLKATKTYQETDDAFAAELRKFDVHHAGGK